jgi:AmmeMemoRadiSam system protein A
MIGPEQEQALLLLAEASIRHGLEHGRPLKPQREEYDPALREPGACFVTLKREGELRGCIGSLAAYRPLAEDVAGNAYAAAFSDPRFYPLQAGELFGLEMHISILGEAEPMRFRSENDLLAQLRPGVDGLIIEEGFRRGTFLPSVWEQLPEAKAFLHHLKLKAGLPVNYWSATISISRYTTHGFGTTIKG